MAIVERIHIEDHGIVGLWHITEPVEELLSMIRFTEGEQETFERFKNKSRKAHWLSYRLAIRQLLGEDRKYSFEYDENGKILLANHDYQLSVTHSGDYSAVIISSKFNVGIDIERISERIKRVAKKFMSKEELKRVPFLRRSKYLTAIWSAKEALYKVCNNRDITFENHIQIELNRVEKKGSMTGMVLTNNILKEYKLYYQFYKNYILVYTIDE